MNGIPRFLEPDELAGFNRRFSHLYNWFSWIYRAFSKIAFATIGMREVRRRGERLLPDKGAVEREGGHGVFIARVVVFLLLIAFLVMYIIGMAWIEKFTYPLPAGLRWAGFGLGLLSVF